MSAIEISRLNEVFSAQNIDLTAEQSQKLADYADLLVDWNEKINLTAITDQEGIIEKHFLDCFLPLTMFNLPENARVVDVGTGAGFPGIPWKIAKKGLNLTLLDSLQKRLTFLDEVLTKIGCEAELVHGRAEDMGNTEMREAFDIATARAVARLSVLAEYCLPFVRVGGYFAALKGPDAENEIKDAENALKILGGKVEKVVEYSLPSGDKRTFVLIKKVKNTPKNYPRPKGKMNKNPL